MNKILNANINTYFLNTKGLWKRCNKPKRKPDFISYKRNFICGDKNSNPLKILESEGIDIKYYKHHFVDYQDDLRVYYEDEKLGISSCYWYGENKKGKYVVRESDHWGNLASCVWGITKSYREEKNCGKIYLKN